MMYTQTAEEPTNYYKSTESHHSTQNTKSIRRAPTIYKDIVKNYGAPEVLLHDDVHQMQRRQHRMEGRCNATTGVRVCALEGINLMIRKKQLVIVMGMSGGGKSSLLNGILGEVRLVDGYLYVNQNSDKQLKYMQHDTFLPIDSGIGYSSQNPWILSGTIRSNILFGRPFKKNAYNSVVAACELVTDFARFVAGDQTELEAGGHSLSGGQRQRIDLARAIYSAAYIKCHINDEAVESKTQEADGDRLYLIDDPFRSLDAITANRIWENVFSSGGILSGFTCVLVTHTLYSFLADPRIDNIVILKDGLVAGEGKFDELTANGLMEELNLYKNLYLEASNRIVWQSKRAIVDDTQSRAKRLDVVNVSHHLLPTYNEADEAVRPQSHVEKAVREAPETQCMTTGSESPPNENAGLSSFLRIIFPEQRRTGSVSLHVWWWYLESMEIRVLVLAILSALAGSYTSTFGDHWVKIWAANSPPPLQIYYDYFVIRGMSDVYFVSIYAISIFSSLIFSAITALSFAYCGLRAATVVHDRMLRNVIRAPRSWFDANPFGRILNRFSDDQYIIDEQVPNILQAFILIAISLSAKMIVLIINFPLMASLLPFLTIFFISVSKRFKRTIREIKRFETTCRSPIYNQLSEALRGGVTIRAFRAEEFFFRDALKRISLHQRVCFAMHGVHAWFHLRSQLIGAVIQATMIMFAILPVILWPEDIKSVRGEFAAIIGLGMYTNVPLVRLLTSVINNFIRLEMLLVAVERCCDYSLVTPEDPQHDAVMRQVDFSRSAQQASASADKTKTRRSSYLDFMSYLSHSISQPSLHPIVTPEWTTPRPSLPSTPTHSDALQGGGNGSDGERHVPQIKTRIPKHLFYTNTGVYINQINTITADIKDTFKQQQRNRLTTEKPIVESPPPFPFYMSFPVAWPSAGLIDFDDVCIEHRPGLTPAISHLSYTIRPGEITGIVGRTGSGKSSLLLAVSRLVKYTGTIKIDGVDIGRVPLSLLRSRVSFVPQSPVIFSGTLRSNLDPEGRMSDDVLWKYLAKCQLKSVVEALPMKLDTIISSDDDTASAEFRTKRSKRNAPPSKAPRRGNTSDRSVQPYAALMTAPEAKKPSRASSDNDRLSLGEKQLLCFCRAVVRESPILCLDEANSSVDMNVDHLIYEAMKNDLRYCTTIAIAHNLHNVISNWDKVLVLDRSRVVETGTPLELLKNVHSKFYELYKAGIP